MHLEKRHFDGGKTTISLVLLAVIWGLPMLQAGLSQTLVRGKVTDRASGEGLPGVTVSFVNTEVATSTDEEGYYELRSRGRGDEIQFKAIGYFTEFRMLSDTSVQTVNLTLQKDPQLLEEVLVTKRGRYRNRDNPAVELIRNVIAHKKVNSPSRFDYLSFETYEKIMMAASDVPEFITNSKLTRGYRFAFENIDTTLVPGRPLLPVYLEEQVSNRYERLSPRASKTITTAGKKTELDKRYVNNENIETYFKFIHGDVDIYANNILILNKPFLGPTAESAPLFYRFYITDTLKTAEGEFVELVFVPRNKEDRLFSGKLHITMDGNYGIRYAEIKIDEQANLNWVVDLNILLRFNKHESGIYLLGYSDVRVNFGLLKSTRGFYGQRTLVHRHYDTTSPIPGEVFSGQIFTQSADAMRRSEAYWQQTRPLPLTVAEANTYINIDSLEHNQSFKRAMDLGFLLFTSFKSAGPVEFGPAEYTYSYNKLEGSRIRLSGRTNRALSEHFYAEAYTAYGFLDQRWKYYLGAAYTLNGRRVNEYPAHYLQVSYQDDAREPGQRLGFRNGDSFIRSFRSGPQDKWLYHNAFRVNHAIEFGNHVMLQTSFLHMRQTPAAELRFINGVADTVGTLKAAEIGLDLRWAPFEEFFQRNLDRSPIINEYPVFNLRYNMGVKGLLGGEHNYQALRFDIFKRVFLSQLGLADVNIGAGYIFGSMPYPLLDIPNASRTYVLTADSYSLMNDLEFVSDRYIKLSIEHRLHGFILNKIPLIKKLKIREIVGFKMLYGGVRPENRPENNNQLFLFPVDSEGNPTTFTLERKPYMETSVGIENIFNVLRVEYIRRLSYLQHPQIDGGGFRFSVSVDF